MKTICFLALFFTLSSCGGGGSVSPSGSYIKMTVAGTSAAGKSWSSDGRTVIGTSLVDGKHNLTLSGRDEGFDGETSSFSAIFSSTTEIITGTYTLSGSDAGVTLTKIAGKTYLGGDMAGTRFVIEITETQGAGLAKKLKGTFSGELKGPAPGDNLTVTGGEFSSF